MCYTQIDDEKFFGTGPNQIKARIEATTAAFNYFKGKMIKPVTESIRLTFESIVQELGLCLPTKMKENLSSDHDTSVYSMHVEVKLFN